MSLLEVITATTIMATMMASTVVVLRGGYAAWQAHNADLERAESAHAVLRHLVRHLRQARGVNAVTPSTDSSGSLSLTLPKGGTDVTYVWSHDSSTGDVLLDDGAATSLLADNIDSLTFTALEADGVTPAASATDAQLVRCDVSVTMPFGGGTSRTVSCTGWIRSWE